MRSPVRGTVTPSQSTLPAPGTPVQACESSAADVNRWFEAEIQPHDKQLKAYLRGSFPTVHDVEDIVQDSYLRVCKARTTHPVASAKAFLFRIARNSAIDWLRRRRISPVRDVTEAQIENVLDSKPAIADALCSREEVDLFALAIDELPARCREIIILRKF